MVSETDRNEKQVTETSRVLYIYCTEGHTKPVRIAKIVPRARFFAQLTSSSARQKFLLYQVNTAETEMPDPALWVTAEGDSDGHCMLICPGSTCRKTNMVLVNETTLRTLIYEPATRAGKTSLTLSEVRSIVTTRA